MEPQLFLNLDLHTWKALQQGFQLKENSDGSISAVYDGDGYKRFSSFLKNPTHISLLVNTDGVAIYRSSVSLWPVWAVVNVLPASLR